MAKTGEGGFLAGGPKTAGRIGDSVKWTEQYAERVEGLLQAAPAPHPPAKAVPAIRCLLLQDCYDGEDALALPVGRDKNPVNAFMVSVIGDNSFSSDNSFKLQLSGTAGATYSPYGIQLTPPTYTVIGLSGVIPVVSKAIDLYAPLNKIDPQINYNTCSVILGNPYIDDDLIQNSQGVYTDQDSQRPAVLLGLWFIEFDAYLYQNYQNLQLSVVIDADCQMFGLTNILVEPGIDVPGVQTTLVTDLFYRPATYAWSAGTVVTCIDFLDIGYGIIGGSTRSLNVTVPLT